MTFFRGICDPCRLLLPFLLMALLVSIGIAGLTTFLPASLGLSPVNPSYIDAPADAKPIAGTDLVVGLSEVLVDEHHRRTDAEAAYLAIRAEAQQIINQLLAEITRLQSRPTVTAIGPMPIAAPENEIPTE